MDALCAGVSGKNKPGRVLAAVRRIGVGLQEGIQRLEKEARGEAGKGFHGKDLLQKIQGGKLSGTDNAKPQILVPSVDLLPSFQYLMGNAISIFYLFQGHGTSKPGLQDMEDER